MRNAVLDGYLDAVVQKDFWEASVRVQEQPGVLLTKALTAALDLDDADAALMLLRPFMIETLRPRHMTSFAALTGRYGEKWLDELLRAWSNRPGYTSVRGLSRPQPT